MEVVEWPGMEERWGKNVWREIRVFGVNSDYLNGEGDGYCSKFGSLTILVPPYHSATSSGRQEQSYSCTGYKSNATSFGGNNASGQARVVKCYNCQGKEHMARKCTQPKRSRNAAWYKDKAMLVEALEAGQILDEEQLAFLTEDIDTYDSDCDDVSNAKAILMANISNYGSEVTQSREKMINTQMDDMIKDKLALKAQIDSLEQNLSKQIKENESLLQTFTVFNSESKEKEDKYIKNEIDLEKKIKELDNVITKWKAQRIKPTLYDGIIISDKHIVVLVIDDEETLILEELDFVVKKRKTPNARTEGLKCSTSNCESKPTCNKKNDKISRTPSRNMKNKVEAQPRKVNKKNRVVESIRDVDVKHSLLKANSELICATCKKSMFDGVHDMRLLYFVENVNSHAKSAKIHKKQNI
nr:hypothetical protein [Tanacetum cinerariifolium]